MMSVFTRCYQVSPSQSKPADGFIIILDAVLMCRDLDPDPPNILESDEVLFFALIHIIK